MHSFNLRAQTVLDKLRSTYLHRIKTPGRQTALIKRKTYQHNNVKQATKYQGDKLNGFRDNVHITYMTDGTNEHTDIRMEG